MRKLLFTITMLCCMYMQAQYFGIPVLKEGFDGMGIPASWVQENRTKDDPCQWISGKNASTPFSKVDATSTNSLEFTINEGNKPYLTLTSPEVDLTGKSALVVGFYGYELSFCMRGAITFIYRVSKDNGATWTNLFESGKDSYNSGVSVSNWNLYKYELPSQFDNSKVKLQFLIDGTAFTGYGGLPGYIDGVFISERYPVDLAINKIYDFSASSNSPTAKAFTSQEAVSVDFTNMGANPVSELELYYQVNDKEMVVEKYSPVQPVQVGQKVKYTFTRKADLSTPLTLFTIKAGVRKEGDGDLSNNELLSYAQNITSGIPYYPRFTWDEGGVPMVDDDCWDTTDKNVDYAGSWERDRSGNFWYIDNEYSDGVCDAYLISRPVVLEKGKTYEIYFNAWVDAETAGEPLNGMKVCVSRNKDVRGDLASIWENKAIGKSNAKNSFARYTATESGPHYFMFNCTSKPTPDYLKVQPLAISEVKRYDIGIMGLSSPGDDTYKFTAAETVSVLLRNYGSETVRASEVTLSMQLNDGEIVTQPLAVDLAPEKTQEFTFTKKLDLSDIDLKKVLTVKANYTSDEATGNNTLKTTLTSVVSGIPYIPDFGVDRYPTKEASLWTIVDNNKDSYAFSSVSDGTLNTYVFSYGGNASRPTIVLQKSDEQLYSRPLWLQAGSTYRLSFLAKIGKAGMIPVKALLYSVEGEQRTLVKELTSVEVSSTNYAETLTDIQIDKSGIYELCYSVVMTTPIDYKVSLGGFKLIKVYDYNLELREIVPASSTVSCYGKFPVGVVVANTGKKEISSFTIKAQSSSIGSKQTTINRTVAPGATALCYFEEDFSFNGEGQELLTASVEASVDQYAGNNSATSMIKYIASATVPYSTGFFTRPEGWLSINDNRDNNRFEFVEGTGGGFRFKNVDGNDPADKLATRCLSLEKDKLYRLSVYSKVLQDGDSASYDIYVYNDQSKEKIAVASFHNLTDTKGSQYLGYFRVPANGNYSVCFDLKGKTQSLMVYNTFEVKEVTKQPDIRVIGVVSPTQDAVFSSDESLTVKFANDGEDFLGTTLFTCEAGEATYHAIRTGTVSAGSEYEVTFAHVDLSRVGEYKLKISAKVACDATPDNNTLEYVLHSLPVVNVSLVGLVSPQSGVLSSEEPICVKVKNSGKGDLNRIPLSAVVTDKDGGKTTLAGMIESALPQGETVEYTFPDKVDMYAEGTYAIEITSSLEGDVDVTDNTYKTSVVSTHKDFDAGISQLVTPKNGLLGEETITVKVTNYTEVDMYNVPVTSVIRFETDAAIAPVIVEGSLAELPANTSVDYTFTQKVNMKPVGDYEVKTYTSVKNDVNLQNDTLTVIVRSYKKDVGVIEILEPETGYDLQTRSITVRVKNFGEAPLSQIPVRYKVGTIPQLGTIAETLEPGATVDYTFSTPYEFASFKVYTVTAYTELEEDFDPSNDAVAKEVENKKPSSVTSAKLSGISVYPNPARDVVNVEAGEALIHNLSVWTNEGVQVMRKDPVESVSCELLLGLPSGNYILRIDTEKGLVYRKLVIR